MQLERLNLETLLHSSKTDTGSDNSLQLSSIKVRDDYRKEWQIDTNDFICLTRNGQLISNSLYRVGGLGTPDLAKDNYFMLLKYVEAYYPADILKMSGSKNPKHLEGRWCILDKNGVEKVEFEPFKTPYLVKDSCIYKINSKYYNIQNGYFYCEASTSMRSTEFLFLENCYDKDISKRGVMKIHKQSGRWEVFL